MGWGPGCCWDRLSFDGEYEGVVIVFFLDIVLGLKKNGRRGGMVHERRGGGGHHY